MSHVPLPELPSRVPDFESERRLAQIRREASQNGLTPANGIIPAGAPFPQATAGAGYYGIPLLKEPQWQKEVPLYLFVGGAAGSSAIVAWAANLLSKDNNGRLITQARWVAAVGGLLSAGLLTKDLGVPSRFINMLRVFKPQSPMNVGAWTLTAFSTFSAAAAFANQVRQKLHATPIYLVENLSGIMAAATGVVMASYTGVLIGGTAIPVWNSNIDILPPHFVASGMNSAVSILELLENDDSRALNLLGLSACAYESLAGLKLEAKRTRVNQPLRQGASGFMVRIGSLLSGPAPLFLRIGYAITGNKIFRRSAAYLSLAGSLLTRFGWVQAGKASARDCLTPLTLPEQPDGSEKRVDLRPSNPEFLWRESHSLGQTATDNLHLNPMETITMKQNDLISVVEKLTETCRDGEKGYKDAAQNVKDPQLKAQFLRYSAERSTFVSELERELSRLGEPPKKEPSSVGATAHRAWMDLKAMVGGGDKTILASVEQGEDSAKEAYQKALQSPLPSELETTVRRQAQSVISAHDRIKSLRESQAA